jgi:hypothetical protein
MKIEWVQVRRRPPWPWWSVVLPALWLTLGGAVVLLSAATGRAVQLCLFKHATGCPCPTCGFTRGTLSFLQGHPVQAWLYNPLLFSFLGVFGAAVAARILLGRGLRVHFTRAEYKAGWIVAVVLFALNWLYVILYVG